MSKLHPWLALIALSIPRGAVNDSYGDWDRLIR